MADILEFPCPPKDPSFDVAEGLRLIHAFTSIKDKITRDGVIAFVESVARQVAQQPKPPQPRRDLHG